MNIKAVSKKNKCEKSHFLINLLCAIIICFGLINGAIGYKGASYLTIAFVFVLFICGMIERKIVINSYAMIIVAFVLIVFLSSFLRVNNTYYTFYYLEYFLGFCVVSMLIGANNFSVKKVLKYIAMIGFFCTSIIIIRGFNSSDASVLMGMAYSLLPVLYASFINVIDRKNRTLLSFVNIVAIIISYLTMAPRGIWLNIIITLLLCFFVFFGYKKIGRKRIIAKIMVLSIIVIGALFVYFNFENILNALSSLIYQVTGGNYLYALDKMIFLFNSGNLSNGRNDLIDLARTMSNGNVFFGCGIGSFEINQGSGGYVHNIFYQAMVEAGIWFLLPILAVILYCTIIIFRISKIENKIDILFFILLLSNGLIILFYSSVYWKLLIFWFLIGYLLSYERKYAMKVRIYHEVRRKRDLLLCNKTA